VGHYQKLKELKDERAVEPLIPLLEDEDQNVRCAAAIVLGEIGDGRAVEPLIRVLSTDESGSVRCMAVESLGKIGDERAIEPLIEAGLSDENSVVQHVAQKALVTFDIDPESSVLIIKLKSKYDFLEAYYPKADELVPDPQTYSINTLCNTLRDVRLPKYNNSSFKCSHAAAYLEWYLEGSGFDASIACGEIWNESHAWVIVELPEADLAIEATAFCEISENTYAPFLPIIAFINPEDPKDKVYYDPVHRYDDVYKLIYEKCGYVWDEENIEFMIKQYDWWNVEPFCSQLNWSTSCRTST
jgi:hypothetical protein